MDKSRGEVEMRINEIVEELMKIKKTEGNIEVDSGVLKNNKLGMLRKIDNIEVKIDEESQEKKVILYHIEEGADKYKDIFF